MRFRAALLFAALLVAAFVVGPGPAAAQPAGEQTRLQLQLEDDGDGNWTIVVTVPLDDEADVENFRRFADGYERGDRDLQLGTDAFRRAAAAASNASGREMTITNESRSAGFVGAGPGDGAGNVTGEVRVSFTWTSFGRIDENGTMYVDDAFRTGGGSWLSSLGPNQTLVIRTPPGYSPPDTAPIGPKEGDLRWEGPRTFEPGYFVIVYEPKAGFERPFDVSTVLLTGALVLSAAALALGLYLLYRRRSDGAVEADAEAAAAAAKAEDADEATATADVASEPADEPAEEPNLELLSDEERVEYLLEENGGRMKQADVVKETGWSNAKVSQLLSSMAEEGRVDKLRIGRENLISLPEKTIAEFDDDQDAG
jgi:uncharacterized membrane protein